MSYTSFYLAYLWKKCLYFHSAVMSPRKHVQHAALINRFQQNIFEPPYDKTNKMTCAHNENTDQPGHPPSLIRGFAAPVKKHWVLRYPLSAQRRLLSDAQADLSLRWAHSSFCWFCHEVAHVTGKAASELLLKGARPIASDKVFRVFRKSGSFDDALSDFYATSPSYVWKYKNQYGVRFYPFHQLYQHTVRKHYSIW